MAIKWVDRVPTYANRVRIVPEDGSAPYYATMERADQPTVVGTPVNAANLNAMQEAAGLSANRTVYVSTTGSDTTGDGSQTAPYASINKALNSIPRNLNGFTATIVIAAGTYNESTYASGFGNGMLVFTGTAGDAVNVTGMNFTNIQYAEIKNIAFSISNSILSAYNCSIRIETPFSTTGGQYGVYANHGSLVILLNTVTINNAGTGSNSIAITATNGSSVYVENLAGNNTVAFAATRGAICSYGTDTSTSANYKYFTERGGRIFSGSQTNAPVN